MGVADDVNLSHSTLIRPRAAPIEASIEVTSRCGRPSEKIYRSVFSSHAKLAATSSGQVGLTLEIHKRSSSPTL